MQSTHEVYELTTFSTDLGWVALITSAQAVRNVAFAYPTAAAAVASLDKSLRLHVATEHRWQWLVAQLQDFAAGRPVDFRDVPLDLDHLAPFQRQVVRHCRAIPYGQTLSYGQLAALADSPRAARAVGSTMAQNRHGLIVPCHRVINANGTPGSYGGPQGPRMKLKLLMLEQRALQELGPPSKTKAKARTGRK